MPYAKKVQRILGGSLNLRSVPTEIPDSDHQKSINLTYDQSDALRPRKGHAVICTASGEVNQMIHALDRRWQATSSGVFADCSSKSSVSNAFIVGFKNYVWIMGSDQKKSNGTDEWDWIPAPPETKATIKTMADAVTLVDDFSGGWSVDSGTDASTSDGSPTTDTGEDVIAFGAFGMRVQGLADTVVSVTKDVSLDLADGQDIDDIFKIKLRGKRWSAISGVTFEVDVGDGTFTNDYYRCRMPLKDIKAARKETITIYIRKRHLEIDIAGQDKYKWGEFTRIGQTTDKDWRSVCALRVKVEFIEQTRFWFVRWEMQGNEDNTLEGDDFGVYYTYTTADGHESNPSPKSDLITVNRGSIQVLDMAQSADPQVTGQNVYLTGGTLGAVYRVNDDPIVGNTYVITDSANDLTDRGIQLETDHDLPPAATGIAGPYYGRILAWSGARFYWTKQNKPFAFKAPDELDGDWADIDENAGDIMWITVRPHEAWIYGQNEIYILVGDPADASGEVQPSGISQGTPSRTGVAKAGGFDVAYLGQGIYLVDGNSATKISLQIEPIFKGRSTTLWDGTVIPPVSDPTSVAVGYDDGVVRVCYDNTYGLTCELATRRWFQDDRAISCYQGDGELGILGGTPDGRVLQLDSGASDSGTPINIDFLSKAFDCGIHDNEKRFEDVTIYHDLAGQTLTGTVYYAEGLGISRVLSGARTVIQLDNADGIRARNLAVRINGEASDQMVIRGIDINYYPEAREAKSYDTAVSNAGTNKVKLIRELLPSLENDTNVVFRLETDVPGFALTERETQTVGTNLFRRAEPIVMSAERYAHDFRVIGSAPSGYFHLFDLQALVQIVGTYIHGQKGEYWLSDPLDFGTERVKMIKEVEVIYSTVGTATLTVSTDLPGNAIVSRGTASFVATTGEQSVKVPLPGTIKGRLLQFRFVPSVDCRVEAIRVFLKLVGQPNATGWEWVSLPVPATQSDGVWVPLSFQQDQVG